MSYDERRVNTSNGPACGDGALSMGLCLVLLYILEIGLFHVKYMYHCTILVNVNP